MIAAEVGAEATTTAAERREAVSGRELLAMIVLWPLAATLPAALHAPPAIAIVCATLVTAAYVRWALFAPDVAARAARRTRFRLLSIARSSWPLVAVAALCAVALVASLHLVAERWAPQSDPTNGLDAYARRSALHAVAVVVVAVGATPLMEELAFRGAVTTALERRFGPRGALALASLGFALAHLQLRLLPQLLVTGLALGLLAWSARSVWAAVLAHGLWNALVFAERVAPASVTAGPGSASTARLIVALVSTALAFALLIWKLRRATTATIGGPHDERALRDSA